MNIEESLQALFNLDALSAGDEADRHFLSAVQAAFSWHNERCDIYRTLCQQAGFTLEQLRTPADLPNIPWLMVNVFKRYHLSSVAESEIVATFTSSGTTGQSSHIAWDKGSMARQDAMRSNIMHSLGLVAQQAVNYLIFAYAPDVAGSKGAAHAQSRYASFAPAADTFYAIHADSHGQPTFDLLECLEQLSRFRESGLPLRVIGFPAFAWRLLQELERRDQSMHFPADSLFILAGGWKGAQNEAVPKDVFNRIVEQRLGISQARIRDVFGFVEHGVPYISCEAGRFHVPVYARAFVRRPGTLALLPEGESGLLQVISPYNLAQPALSVLATDYVIVGRDCPCGRPTATLEIVGRAGLAKHQGCAITAAELLKK